MKSLYHSTHLQISFGSKILLKNPLSRFRSVDTCGMASNHLFSGLIVIEINVAVIIFAVGCMAWIVRFIFQAGS